MSRVLHNSYIDVTVDILNTRLFIYLQVIIPHCRHWLKHMSSVRVPLQ